MAEMNPDNLGEQLSAYLDGELNETDRAAVEATLRDSADARAALEKLRATTSMVEQLPRTDASTTLVGDVMATIERGQLLGDQPVDAPTGRPASGRFKMLLSVAAMVGLSVSAGIWGLLYSTGSVERRALVDAGSLESSTVDEVANKRRPAVDPSLLAMGDDALRSLAKKDVAIRSESGSVFRARRSQEQPAVAATPRPTIGAAESTDTNRDDFREKSRQAYSKTTGAAVAGSRKVESRTPIVEDGDTTLAMAAEPRDAAAMNQAVAGRARAAGVIPQRPVPAAMARVNVRPEVQQKIAGRDIQQASAGADLQLVVTCRNLDDLTRGTVAINRVAAEERFAVAEVRGLSRVAGAAATSPTGPADRRQHSIERVVHLPKLRVISLLESLERDDQGRRRPVELSAGPLVHARGWDDAYTLVAMVAPKDADGQIVAKGSAAREQHEAGLPAAASRSRKVKKAPAKKNEAVEAEKPASGGAIERMLNDIGVPLNTGPPADRPDAGGGVVEDKLGARLLQGSVDPMIAVRIVLIASVTTPPPGPPGRLAPR